MKELDKVREIFAGESVDEETRKENEEQIREWESSIRENEAFLSWREHDITTAIAKRAKEQYREIGLILAVNRKLTDAERLSLWAKQDAMAWLLSLTERDAKGEIERIRAEIKRALT